MPEILWVVVVVALLVFYLSWTATRVDRLHARVEAARAALDAQLARRSSVALELAASSLLDPAAAMLVAGAAHEAREAEPGEQEITESDLSRSLRAALDQPGQDALLRSTVEGRLLVAELDAAARRVVMARRFHNDAVRATRAVRRKRPVRYLRLGGRAPVPASFECDDDPPVSLAHEL